MSSDAASSIRAEVGNDLCSISPLADVRPQTAECGGLAVSAGGHVQSSVFGGTGRPTAEESDRRRVEFLRLVAEGISFDEAARQAKIQPIRALAILSHPDVRPLLARAA